MTLLLRAAAYTVCIFLIALTMLRVADALTHNGAVALLMFWIFVFLGLLAFTIDEQKRYR
jgi:hypothetical protein